jgi:hypothetical protein
VRRIAPQQYRIAVQQRQAILLMDMAAMRSERRLTGERQLTNAFQREPEISEAQLAARRYPAGQGLGSHIATRQTGGARPSVSRWRPDVILASKGAVATLKKRRPPVGGLSLGRKRPRRACTANTVRVIVWRQIQQMQDLNTGFELHVPPCDVFATAEQARPQGGKPILWLNQ